MQLDETDLAILRSLQADARLSLRDIAARAGVSAPTVASRLANLESLGVVRGYRAAIDPERLHEVRLHAMVKARLQAVDKVAAELSKIDRVRRVTIARGGRILVDATASSGHEIDAVLDAVAGIADVMDLEHHVGVRTVKDEPPAVLAEGLTVALACFQCKKPIEGEPIKVRLEGRDHYLCCRSCEKLYLEKYTKMKASA